MTQNRPLVDVLILLPEYSERNTLVDSALQLVRQIGQGKFQFTLIDFPEEDPRFFEDASGKHNRKVISHGAFLRQVEQNSELDRGFDTNFDILDNSWSFQNKIEAIQNWLQDESEDYWYEMDRPDFSFSKERTLGVYLNPNPHLDNVNSGQLEDYKNVFFVQLSSLHSASHELHIQLAKFMWTAPFRFLLEQYGAVIRRDIGISPSVILGDIRAIRLKQLLTIFEKNNSQTSYHLRQFMTLFISGIERLDQCIADFRRTVSFNRHLVGNYNPETYRIEIEALSIYIPLTFKERLVYRFLTKFNQGLSQEDVIKFRAELIQMALNDGGSNEGFDARSAGKLVDQLAQDEGLRKVVSQINRKFEPFILIPKMKRFTIYRVGYSYRLLGTAITDNFVNQKS